jgi:hypothetical protein
VCATEEAFYTLTIIARSKHNMHPEIQASAIREHEDERRGMRCGDRMCVPQKKQSTYSQPSQPSHEASTQCIQRFKHQSSEKMKMVRGEE